MKIQSAYLQTFFYLHGSDLTPEVESEVPLAAKIKRPPEQAARVIYQEQLWFFRCRRSCCRARRSLCWARSQSLCRTRRLLGNTGWILFVVSIHQLFVSHSSLCPPKHRRCLCIGNIQ